MSGAFRIQWNEMRSAFQDNISQLFDQGDLVDVTLACEDFRVKCHRLILASYSTFLADMIRRNPSPDLVICLVGIKRWQLSAILSYMYRGVIEHITQNQIQELVKVADYLGIQGFRLSGTIASPEDESTMTGKSSGKNEVEVSVAPAVMQKKRKLSQMHASEPILIDLTDGDSSPSGRSVRSDTTEEYRSSGERNDIVGDGNDQERLPMTKPIKKRPVVIIDEKESIIDNSQSLGNEGVSADARVDVADWSTQNENGVDNSTEKTQMQMLFRDRQGSCDSANGSGLDPNLLMGLGLPSDEGAEDTVSARTRTKLLNETTQLKGVQKKRVKKPRMPKLSSRPDIGVYPVEPAGHITIARSEDVHLQNNHHQSNLQVLPQGNSTQAPPLTSDATELYQLMHQRLTHGACFVAFGLNIEQASACIGIPVPYLMNFLRTPQEDGSYPTADIEQSSDYIEREMQANAMRIYNQALLNMLNIGTLPGQSSSNPNVPQNN